MAVVKAAYSPPTADVIFNIKVGSLVKAFSSIFVEKNDARIPPTVLHDLASPHKGNTKVSVVDHLLKIMSYCVQITEDFPIRLRSPEALIQGADITPILIGEMENTWTGFSSVSGSHNPNDIIPNVTYVRLGRLDTVHKKRLQLSADYGPLTYETAYARLAGESEEWLQKNLDDVIADVKREVVPDGRPVP